MDWLTLTFLLFSSCGCYIYSVDGEKTFTSDTIALVNYTIWSSENVDDLDIKNILVEVDSNTTFFAVVVRAAEINNNDFWYRLEDTPSWERHYIISLHGVEEDVDNNLLWILYQLPGAPDPNNPPSDDYITVGGVDDVRVSDGDNFLFWLRDLSNPNLPKEK